MRNTILSRPTIQNPVALHLSMLFQKIHFRKMFRKHLIYFWIELQKTIFCQYISIQHDSIVKASDIWNRLVCWLENQENYLDFIRPELDVKIVLLSSCLLHYYKKKN